MEELRELVDIVSKQKLKGLNVMAAYAKEGKLNSLYEGVHSGKFSSDVEAIEALYPNKDSGKDSYRKLKKRLVEQLVNTVFFIGASDNLTKHQQAVYNCLKYSTAARLVRLRSGFKMSEILAKKTLKTSMEQEQSAVALDMLDLLRGLMSRNGDKKAFEKYNRLFEEYNQLLQAEYKAKGYLDHVVMLLSRSAAMKEVLPLIKEYEKELRQIKLERTSSSFLAYSYLLYVDRCEFENDHKGLQENCEEIINLLEKRGSKNRTFVFVFLFKSLDTYRRFQQFEKGKEALRKSLAFTSGKQSANWVLVKSHYVRLCFFCNKIEEGYVEFQSVLATKMLKRLSPAEQESWEIYKAYFAWFKSIGRLVVEEEPNKRSSFRLGKFINMVSIQNKDKAGYNAAVLVLQLLFLIQMRNHDALIDKTEALKAYTYRYLRQRQMYRTNCFVKLLLLIPSCSFNKIAILRKSESLYSRMSSRAVSEGSISTNMEIVPYETLWKVVLELLDSSFSR